jgi:hypothetical protein
MKKYWKCLLDFSNNLWAKLKKVTVFEYSLVFLLLVLLVVFYFIDLSFSEKQIPESSRKFTDYTTSQDLEVQTLSPSPTPKPTPKPIPSGERVYNLSHGKGVLGPRISQAIINPLDPLLGEIQVVTVMITHTSPVMSVKATLESDNMDKTYTFKRIAGNDTDGTWQASWKIEDSYDYTYYLFFELISEVDTFEGGLTFR